MPKIVVEFMLERHPKELPLISMFVHLELKDEKMQAEFKEWQKERNRE